MKKTTTMKDASGILIETEILPGTGCNNQSIMETNLHHFKSIISIYTILYNFYLF